MKNLKKIDSLKKARELQIYIINWRNYFDNIVYRDLMRTLGDLFERKLLTSNEYDQWEHHLRNKLWSFVNRFQLPIDFEDDYFTSDMIYRKYQDKINKWERDIRKQSNIAWKALNEFVDFITPRLDKPLTIETPEIENTTLEGFKIHLIYLPNQQDKIENLMKTMEKALSLVVSGSQKFFPLLIKKKPLIKINTVKQPEGASGLYSGTGEITLTRYELGNRDPKDLAKTIAHEMGHMIYHEYISRKNQKNWSDFIYGNYKYLDLRKVYKDWSHVKTLNDKKIAEVDPILSLQLDSLMFRRDKIGQLISTKRLKEYLERGGDPMVTVPAKPISGYATVNADEAYAEAVSHMIIYPQAIFPEIKSFVKMISH